MKTKLKIIFGIIIFFATNLAFGFNVDFDVNKTKLDLNDSLNLNVIVSGTGNMEKIEIPGIDNFSVIGKSQSQSISIINGVTETSINVRIQLKPQKAGEYKIGPIVLKAGNKEFTSEKSVNITVIDLKIGINTNSGNLNNGNTKNDDKNSLNKESDLSQNNEKINTDSQTPKIQDLNDIDPVKYKIGNFSFMFVFIIIFLVLAYFFINYLLSKKGQVKEIQPVKEFIDEKDVIRGKLIKLKEKTATLEKVYFYAILNMIFREYFEYLGVKDSSKKTYFELENTILKEKEIFKLFRNSYLKEFDNSEDNSEIRTEILEEFMAKLEEK